MYIDERKLEFSVEQRLIGCCVERTGTKLGLTRPHMKFCVVELHGDLQAKLHIQAKFVRPTHKGLKHLRGLVEEDDVE